MTAIAVIVAMVLGIALAVLLDKKFLGRGIVRTLIITPFLVMPAAAALIWSGPMLDPNFGLLNWLLEPFGVNHVAWLTTHAYGSVIVVMVWQWTPFMTLIVLAGLQGQGADVLEAAKVDGAGALGDLPRADPAASAAVHRARRPARLDLPGDRVRPGEADDQRRARAPRPRRCPSTSTRR